MNNVEIFGNPRKEELKIASLLLGFDIVNGKVFKNGFMGNPLIAWGVETGGLRYSPIYSDVYVLKSDYRYSCENELIYNFFSRNGRYLNSVITEDRIFLEKLIVLMIKCSFTPEQAFYSLCRESSEFLSKDKNISEKESSSLENQFIYKLHDYLHYLRIGWGRGKVEEIQEEFINRILSINKDDYLLAIELLGKESDGFYRYIKKRKPRTVSENKKPKESSGLEKKVILKKSTKKKNDSGLSESKFF